MRLYITFLFLLLSGINSLAESKISIGVAIPLSGELAEYGVALRNGIELARLNNPESFTNLEFVYEDIKYDGKLAISTFHKLRASDSIKLIYVWGSGPSEAVAPIAERHKFPTVIMGEVPSAQGRNFVLNYANPAWHFSEAVLKHLRIQGAQRLALVKTEIAYFDGLERGLRKYLTENESLEVIASLNPEDVDLKTAVSKLRKRDFDAVGVFLLPGQVQAFYRAAATQGLKTPTFGNDAFESRTEIEASGTGIQGAIFADNAVKSDFSNQYIKHFNSDLQLTSAARGYDFANILAQIIHIHGSTLSEQKLWDSLKEIDSFNGVAGKLTYKNTPETGQYLEYPVRIKKIIGGRVEVIG